MLKEVKRSIGASMPRLRDFWRIHRGFASHHGYYPNIFSPKSFSEKIQRRKFFDRDPRLPRLADKIAVKSYVEERLGPDWIIPTIWSGAELPQTPEWQMPFVLKASHGSGMNCFVRNTGEFDLAKISSACESWLSETYYGAWGGEWLYSQIPPRLLVEPFMSDADGTLPLDYKLWVFHGRVRFIQVDVDRETAHTRTMFDRDWNKLPFTLAYPLSERPIGRPTSLTEMIAAAEMLASDLPFVRVDFYEIGGTPKFGEMTFYPGSGWERFMPVEYDQEVGALW